MFGISVWQMFLFLDSDPNTDCRLSPFPDCPYDLPLAQVNPTMPVPVAQDARVIEGAQSHRIMQKKKRISIAIYPIHSGRMTSVEVSMKRAKAETLPGGSCPPTCIVLHK